MSAVPSDFLAKTAGLSESVIAPFPASTKIYQTGSRPDIRVPMREVTLTPTRTDRGVEINPPVTIYDTSGPYTDPKVKIDLLKGLDPLRANWIAERADTETGSSKNPTHPPHHPVKFDSSDHHLFCFQ